MTRTVTSAVAGAAAIVAAICVAFWTPAPLIAESVETEESGELISPEELQRRRDALEAAAEAMLRDRGIDDVSIELAIIPTLNSGAGTTEVRLIWSVYADDGERLGTVTSKNFCNPETPPRKCARALLEDAHENAITSAVDGIHMVADRTGR